MDGRIQGTIHFLFMKYPIYTELDNIETPQGQRMITRYITDHPNVLFINITGSIHSVGDEKMNVSLDILFKDETRQQFMISPHPEDFKKNFELLINKAERFLENHNSGTLKPLDDAN